MARKSRKQGQEAVVQEERSVYRCGFYLRLSDEDKQALEENSIGNQRKICMDYVNGHQDLIFIKTYVDNGFTGTNFARDGFARMLEDIDMGVIDCVIVKDLSRFGREYIGAGEFLERIFPEKNVRFIAVNNHYDSETADSGDGLSLPITNIANEFYSRDTSRKIQSAIQTKIRAGEFMASAGAVPYGYIRGEERFLVDPEVKPVIIRIYELRRQGMAFHAIAKALNGDQIPSPGKLRYMRGITKKAAYEHALWNRKIVREILHNEVYLGHRIHGKQKREKMGMPKKQTDMSEWQYIYHAHEPVITQELFDEVQLVNQAEKERVENYQTRNPVKEDFRSLFSGRLFCGDCGARMKPQKRVQRSTSSLPSAIFYQCGCYVQDRNSSRCFNHYIPEAEIREKVEHYLNVRLSMVPEVEQMLQKNRKSGEESTELAAVSKQKLECEERKERLWKDYMDRLLDKEEFLYAKKKYDESYLELCQREEDLLTRKEKKRQNLSEAARWMASMKKYQKVRRLDEQMISLFVKQIRVYGGRQLEFVMNYKDDMLEEVKSHAG